MKLHYLSLAFKFKTCVDAKKQKTIPNQYPKNVYPAGVSGCRESPLMIKMKN